MHRIRYMLSAFLLRFAFQLAKNMTEDSLLYMCGKSLQFCLTLCHPTDCSPVHGILQAKLLEWVAIPSYGDLPNPGIEST